MVCLYLQYHHLLCLLLFTSCLFELEQIYEKSTNFSGSIQNLLSQLFQIPVIYSTSCYALKNLQLIVVLTKHILVFHNRCHLTEAFSDSLTRIIFFWNIQLNQINLCNFEILCMSPLKYHQVRVLKECFPHKVRRSFIISNLVLAYPFFYSNL